MTDNMTKSIPIIDLFAGPGGLGEGFASYQRPNGQNPFKIRLSIEKDIFAHKTLTLRSFFRLFDSGAVPDEYYDFLRSAQTPESDRWRILFGEYQEQAAQAEETALLAELGIDDHRRINAHIEKAINGFNEFVLLGGPPCQAYSIMGRSRNRGNPNYRATEDTRQWLYVEYLQVLADFRPAVFIMENVKGLLSATLENQRIFELIMEDLRSPCEAIRREGRKLADGRHRTQYNLLSFVQSNVDDADDLRRFIIRMEKHGVPQARHRLIIVGVRSDLNVKKILPLPEIGPIPIIDVISDLPEVRSGISTSNDSQDFWIDQIREINSLPFMNGLKDNIDMEIINVLKNNLRSLRHLSRGGEFVKCNPRTQYRPDWFTDPRLHGVCNHSTRPHIPSDLHRYLYAVSYASVKGRSPDLRNFPPELLPKHRNAKQSATNGFFDDRFHVQLADRPSTTVTSHLAKDGHYFIHPDPLQCRSMTVREVARLQTFPDNYFFCGPRTAQYIQVGNAVPPLLANQIAASVFTLLKECNLAG